MSGAVSDVATLCSGEERHSVDSTVSHDGSASVCCGAVSHRRTLDSRCACLAETTTGDLGLMTMRLPRASTAVVTKCELVGLGAMLRRSRADVLWLRYQQGGTIGHFSQAALSLGCCRAAWLAYGRYSELNEFSVHFEVIDERPEV